MNKKNIDAKPEIYKLRQAIVEHPYGTIKRQWGFCHILTKRGIKRAAADVGFIMVAYNLRRIINILDKNVFKKFLEELVFLSPGILAQLKVKCSVLKHSFFQFKYLSFIPK